MQNSPEKNCVSHKGLDSKPLEYQLCCNVATFAIVDNMRDCEPQLSLLPALPACLLRRQCLQRWQDASCCTLCCTLSGVREQGQGFILFPSNKRSCLPSLKVVKPCRDWNTSTNMGKNFLCNCITCSNIRGLKQLPSN